MTSLSDARNRPRFRVRRHALAAVLLLTTILGGATARAAELSSDGGATDSGPFPVTVHAPVSVGQGEVLTVSVTGERLSEVTVTLTLPGGAGMSTAAWREAAQPGTGREAWVALLGVPSTAGTGTASLSVTVGHAASPADRPASSMTPSPRSVQVVPRTFRHERIALDSAMSDLRTSDDPRKAEQSRVLWNLLQTVDPAARYHTGAFRVPVSGYRQTSFFGDRRDFRYRDGGQADAIHNGWDLAAPTGTPVVAPGAGRVVMARDRVLTGLTVVLEHLPGVYTMYYHMDSLAVDEGDAVAAGAPLGTVGSTGLSTGPHLHWELRVAGQAVSPEPFLAGPLVDRAALLGSLSTLP